MATKLGAVAKCVFSELLYGCRGGRSEIKSLHLLEVSSHVLTYSLTFFFHCGLIYHLIDQCNINNHLPSEGVCGKKPKVTLNPHVNSPISLKEAESNLQG